MIRDSNRWNAVFYANPEQRLHNDFALFNLDVALTNIVRGVPYYHLWYLYMIVGLAVFTPFVRQFVVTSSPKLIRTFILAGFLVASIEASGSTLMGSGPATFLGVFPLFVPYFVAGYYLRAVGVPKPISAAATLAVAIGCTGLIALATGALLASLGSKSWDLMYAKLNPLVIVMSLVVFRFAIGFRLEPGATPPRMALALVRHLAPLTLGIYLIHPFWLTILAGKGISGFWIHPLLGIPVTSLGAFVLSAFTAAVLSAIPVVRATVK